MPEPRGWNSPRKHQIGVSAVGSPPFHCRPLPGSCRNVCSESSAMSVPEWDRGLGLTPLSDTPSV
jgi:hypothetical protein